MARRNVKVIERETDPVNEGKSLAEMPDDVRQLYVPSNQLEQDFATEEEEIASVLAEAGGAEGGGFIVVRKVNPETRKFEWLIKFHSTADFVSLGGVEHLAAKYGGGDYELLIYGADKHIVKRPKLTISSAAEAQAKNSDAGIERLAGVMMDGFKQLAAQQAQLAQQLQRPAESKQDWLRELAMMREIFGAPQQQSDPLGTLAKVIPVVRDMMPRGEGGTNLLDVMVELAKEFAPAIKIAVEKSPALLASVPGATPAVANPPKTPEEIGANQMQIMLRAQLQMLCNEAKADSDPGPYAAIICEKVSPEILSTWINNPDYLAELGKIQPGVLLFPKWFGELRDAIIEIMSDETGGNSDDLTGGQDGTIRPEIPE